MCHRTCSRRHIEIIMKHKTREIPPSILHKMWVFIYDLNEQMNETKYSSDENVRQTKKKCIRWYKIYIYSPVEYVNKKAT